jgi:hypothetical protein
MEPVALPPSFLKKENSLFPAKIESGLERWVSRKGNRELIRNLCPKGRSDFIRDEPAEPLTKGGVPTR